MADGNGTTVTVVVPPGAVTPGVVTPPVHKPDLAFTGFDVVTALLLAAFLLLAGASVLVAARRHAPTSRRNS